MIALYIPRTNDRLLLHPTKPSISDRAQQQTPVYPKKNDPCIRPAMSDCAKKK